MFRRAAATCVVVAAVAAAAPLGEGSEVLLPGPDFAAPVGDGDGVAVAARGAAPRRSSLGALLAPLHEALRGVWAAPHVLLRDGAGARDRARESELAARNRTVGDFLAFLEAGRVSGVLLLEALPPGAARAFYDDALLGGGWSGGCAACSAHVYVSPPGLSALRNHTDATPVRVFQLAGAKDWRACAAAPAPALAVPLDFAAKLGTCATYDAGEMADATSDRALGLLDCAAFSLAAGESVSVPRRTVLSGVTNVFGVYVVELRAGQEKRAKFPTSKPHISAVFHSFRLMFGRAIISRNGLEAWMLFPERACAEHAR